MYSISVLRIANIGRCATAGIVRVVAVALALASVSGCALFSDQLDRAAKGAGKVVKQYCENVTIPEVREEIRAAVNKHAAPHSVAVECVDGGPILKTGEGEAVESLPAVAPPANTDDGSGPVAKKSTPVIIFEKWFGWLNPVIIFEQEKSNG